MINNHPSFRRTLSVAEAKTWRQKIEAMSHKACTPLHFSRATGDDMPLPLEVVRNDAGQVIVHVFRRPDIAQERGEVVVAAAMLEVFGPPSEGMRDASGEITGAMYRDEEEIMKAEGLKRKVLPTDSWYLEFPAAMSMILPDTDFLKDKLAAAVKNAWSRQD